MALNQFYSEEYYAKSKQVTKAELTLSKLWQRDFLYTWLVGSLPVSVEDWEILDIGAGYGTWLQWFNKSNRTTGIESSRQACEVARSVFGHTMHKSDFLENNLPGDGFDLITGLAIIEHFNDPLDALIEMNRLLKMGGYLYLQTPDIHGMVLRQGIYRYFKVVHTYYFSLVTLTSLLSKAGFEIVLSRCRPPMVKTTGFLWPDNYWSGELDILARKIHNRDLVSAQVYKHNKDNPEEVLSSLDYAMKRDKAYIFYAKIHRTPIIRIPFKILFTLARQFQLPGNIFEEQKNHLNLRS
jgi:ubiquinone/menaquinone biosynthesis C-methylase UbiE